MEKEKYYVSTLGLTITQLFLFFIILAVLNFLKFNISSNLEINLLIIGSISYLIANMLAITITFLFVFRSKWYWFIQKEALRSIIISFAIQMLLIYLLTFCFGGPNIWGVLNLILSLLIGFILSIGFYWILSKVKRIGINIEITQPMDSTITLAFLQSLFPLMVVVVFWILGFYLYRWGWYPGNKIFGIILLVLYFLSNVLATILVILSKKHLHPFPTRAIWVNTSWNFFLQIIIIFFINYFITMVLPSPCTYKEILHHAKQAIVPMCWSFTLCFLSTIGTCWIVNKITNERGE
ncbi:MAG: hypothetical protein WCR55_10325 [Lentisphaerota bacterium]